MGDNYFFCSFSCGARGPSLWENNNGMVGLKITHESPITDNGLDLPVRQNISSRYDSHFIVIDVPLHVQVFL